MRSRRTIPVLTAAADSIAKYLAAVQAAPGAGAPPALPAAVSLPDELQAVLSHSNVVLRYLPRTLPRVPRAELFDARVHPERAPSGSTTTVPGADTAISRQRGHQSEQHATFTFVELFAGLGVRVQGFKTCTLSAEYYL